MRALSLFSIILIILAGCGTARQSFDIAKKYSRSQLEKDYSIYRKTLETHHPSLYWYTPKDSMDYYFDWGESAITDAMTEAEFRKVLTYVTSQINCGHTTVRASKKYLNTLDTVALKKVFPLSVKFWEDTMVVAANLHRGDSILRRGTVITSINGQTLQQLSDTLFQYLSTDGYNRTHKFQTLSNRGIFGGIYAAVFGLKDSIAVTYIDSVGQEQGMVVPIYKPINDSTRRQFERGTERQPPSTREIRETRRNNVRLLQIDTTSSTALMSVNSFSKGHKLKKFFKRSFKTLKKDNIQYLIIDVRNNGGGTVSNSTLLTKYLSDHPFKIADSLYAVKKGSKYDKYIGGHFWNKLFFFFFTKKKAEGKYHFNYFERKYYRPKKKNKFDKNIYVLTGGNSFSATTLMASTIKGQQNTTIIGEETGGGAYGNSAWLIPDITLPETKVRIRLPLFRLVIDKNIPKNGQGLQPDIYTLPTVNAVVNNIDFKLAKALELIKADKASKKEAINYP